MERELIEATVYECNYKDFSKATTKDGTPIYDWSNAVWSLYNTKNSYSNAVLKLDILQRGKDENGFYQNYIYLVVKRNSEYMWEEYLKSLGYGFSKYEITLCRIFIGYEEGIDEYLLEVD